MSDSLTEDNSLQVDATPVDASLHGSEPVGNAPIGPLPADDTTSTEESMAPGIQSNGSTQNAAEPLDEVFTEKHETLNTLSNNGAHGPDTLDTLEESPLDNSSAESSGDSLVEGENGTVADTPQVEFPALQVESSPRKEEDAPLQEPASPENSTPIATISRPPAPDRHFSRTKLFLIGTLLLFLLSMTGTIISAILAFNDVVNAYTTYTLLHNSAYDGAQHLLNVKTIFTGLSTHPTGFLDVSKLQHAQKEFAASRKDFQQVQYTLDHAAIISTVTEYLPQYRSEIASARSLSKIGIDVADIGQELISTAMILAPTFRGSLLNDTHQPLVTPAMFALIGTTIDYMLPRLSDIQAQSAPFSPGSLPVSAHQREQLAQLLQAIPQAETDLTQVHGLLDAAGWMLGANSPRTFLVQTMDRAELRPTGGFTGQFGELSIKGGRVGPFSLKDISLVEYTDNSRTLGLLALPQYRSWWPFANWGLRDSNLSADFPTSAQIAINKYKSEVGHRVDGVIMFTPFAIEDILQVIGPIKMPGYNDTITAQNLEERLHYYQQDNVGIAKQVVFQPGDTSTSIRKRFTALLAHILMDRIRHAPPDEIISIARQLLHDLKTRDVQIYVTNPQIEHLLEQFGDGAQIDRSTTHDGLYVVQANVSASKASQYVRTILHDTVTLNTNGGATHVLQIRLAYSQVGPVYGYDTYHDYVRVYVPPESKYLWGDGFDTGKPLCGADLGNCQQYDVYPRDELLCPAGQFQPGAHAPEIADEDGGRWHPLDTVGPPPNFASDEPGRAMFGGWVVVPKNCTMTVTLSWYVPPLGQNNPYTLLFQRQAGTFPEFDLTILPTPGSCAALHTPGLHFDGILGEDTSYSLKENQLNEDARTGCYPQPGI